MSKIGIEYLRIKLFHNFNFFFKFFFFFIFFSFFYTLSQCLEYRNNATNKDSLSEKQNTLEEPAGLKLDIEGVPVPSEVIQLIS